MTLWYKYTVDSLLLNEDACISNKQKGKVIAITSIVLFVFLNIPVSVIS